METEDFPCPKCSQLNTANRTTCKDCGADLRWAVPYNMPMEKTTRGINFKVFFAIVILVILSVVALPRVCYISGSELSAARGVGSAINSTIQAEHSDYLNNGNYHSQNPFI